MDREQQGERWDVVIGPSGPWWHIGMGELWGSRDLLLLLVRRDLLAVYKQSILGPLWQVLQPLLTSVMFAVVFGLMARVPSSEAPPLLFYLSGVVPWTFFANIVSRTSQTLIWNAHLMSKIHFPRLLAPMATTLSTGVGFLVQLAVFVVIAVICHMRGEFEWHLDASIVLLPVLVILMMALAFGTGILVAALTTKYRDLSFLLAFGIQLLLFMSPVIFPLSMVPEGSPLRWLILLNPMTGIIEGFRAVLLGLPMNGDLLFLTTGVAGVALILGLAVFQRVQRSFTDVA